MELSANSDDHRGIDLRRQQKLADPGPFVGVVQVGGEVMLTGSESNAAGDMVNIGQSRDQCMISFLISA